jgi:choline dehydrogenase
MTWDFIIVGGGSAGCVMANRLSETGSHRVLLIEAGGSDLSLDIQVPALTTKIYTKPDRLWDYQDEPDTSRDNRVMAWRAGRVLGGGSSVNGMVWVRGHESDFDRWAELGCTGWDYASVLPFFRKAERSSVGEDRYRGRSGPERIQSAPVSHVMTDAFVQAASHAGHPRTFDYNGGVQEGVDYGQGNIRRGFRHSTARAYLAPARRRKNLDVHTNTFVQRVVFDGDRATGVEVEHHDGRIEILRATSEVILAAGGIGSPKLLMLSGIGPAGHLRELGIPVVRDVAGVGENLQEHPVAQLMWEVDVPTFNMDYHWRGMIKHGLQFALRGRGIAASSIFHALVFLKLDPHQKRTEIEAGFTPFGVTTHDDEKEQLTEGAQSPSKVTMSPDPRVATYVSLLHPRSRGTVRLRSSRPHDAPVIRMEMFSEPQDLADLREGCRKVQEIARTSPMREHVTVEITPGAAVNSDDEWERYLRENTWGAFHACGTCRMGSDTDPLSVLDEQLRVRGVRGLRVADGSIMPEITSGNTNAPIIMIGEKAAHMVLASEQDDRPVAAAISLNDRRRVHREHDS